MCNDDFDKWMKTVDAIIAGRMGGLDHNDLVDCTYRDWFDAGWSAVRAARTAIRNNNE